MFIHDSTLSPSSPLPDKPIQKKSPPQLRQQLSDLTELFIDSKKHLKNQVILVNKKKTASEKEKVTIEKELGENNKELSKISKKIEIIASELSLDKLTEEDIPLIFKVEHQLRDILYTDDKEKPSKKSSDIPLVFDDRDKYKEIHDKIFLPVIEKAKGWIKKRPISASTRTAAARGEAAQAAFEGLRHRSETGFVLKAEGSTASDVFLIPPRTVFKKSVSAREEEEVNVNQLMGILSPKPILGSFSIREPSLSRFGIELSPKMRERGYPVEKIPSALKQKFIAKLSKEDAAALEHFESEPAKMSRQLENYQDIQQQKWSIRNNTTTATWREISFEKLRETFLRIEGGDDSLLSSFVVAPTSELDKGLSLEEHRSTYSPLFQALNYVPSLDTPARQLFFIPQLDDPATKEAFEDCEGLIFIYKDDKGIEHQVNFKTFYSQYMLEESMDEIAVKSPKFPTPKDAKPYIDAMLKMKWKLMSSELVTASKSGRISELTYVQGKPFKKMILVDELYDDYRTVLDHILESLTPESEYMTVLTGVIQLLDLHTKNLGFTPESTPEYERFKDLEFTIDSTKYSFFSLLKDYWNGDISLEKPIEFTENGETTKKLIKDLPDLRAALKVKFNIVLFDVDGAISESNHFMKQINQNTKGHLNPIRSCLLSLPFKHQALKQNTIEALLGSEKSFEQAKKWMARTDAPIYKRLSDGVKKKVEEQLKPIIEKYELSASRQERDQFITFEDLHDKFIKNLSNISGNEDFWKMIENDLSSVVIGENDTLEKIAKRFHQSEEELRAFNPPPFTFKPGQKVKIKYDLLSKTPEARKKRKQIARQIFPRLTTRQQNAMIERHTRCIAYLKNIQALKNSTLEGEELIKEIEEFIQHPTSPFSSVDREQYLSDLQKSASLSMTQKDILDFRKIIFEAARPTYLNVLSAMYPTLRDSFELLSDLLDESSAGIIIGHPSRPLEMAIREGLKKKGSKAEKLARNLRAQIKMQPVAFHRNWDTYFERV